jgi:hypothetical protein
VAKSCLFDKDKRGVISPTDAAESEWSLLSLSIYFSAIVCYVSDSLSRGWEKRVGGGKVKEGHMWSTKPEPESERRVINRVHTAIPVTIQLLGKAGAPLPITVQTANISPRGVSAIIQIRIAVNNGRVSIYEEVKNSAKMVKYLLEEDTIVGVGLPILPGGESIHAMGTVKWRARTLRNGLYSLKAGIFLNEIDRADKKEWFTFLMAIYAHLACFHRELEDAQSPMTPLYPGYPA